MIQVAWAIGAGLAVFAIAAGLTKLMVIWENWVARRTDERRRGR